MKNKFSIIRTAVFWTVVFFLGIAPARSQEFQPPVPGENFQDSPAEDQTFIAWSSDGINWKPEERPVFEHASVADIFVTKSGQFLLCWVDFSKAEGPGSETLSMSNSTDGRQWSEPHSVEIRGMIAGNAVDPSLVELDGGKLRLYYFAPGPDEETHLIKSAVSSDGGKIFTEEEGVRVQGEGITDPDVIQKSDGTWIMYLSHGRETLIAVSSDGLNFEDTGAVVETGGVPGALLLDDKRIRLFVTTREGIRSLISSDGISFVPEPGIRIPNIENSRITADPSLSRALDGKWVMAFKRRPS